MLTQSLPQSTDVSRSVLIAAQWLKNNYEYCSTWNNSDLTGFLQWHANRKLLGIVWHYGDIEAVATVRCLHDEEDHKEDYFHDPTGDIVYCSHFCSTTNRGTRSMLTLLLQNFYQSRIAFTQKRRMYKEYDMMSFVSKFRGLIYGK